MIKKRRQTTSWTATRFLTGERFRLVGFDRSIVFSSSKMQIFGSNATTLSENDVEEFRHMSVVLLL
jgi:hypothetical protein